MFKFIKGHLETITGIEIYPLISLLIFFTFFVAFLILVGIFTAKKEYINKVFSNIPLDQGKNSIIMKKKIQSIVYYTIYINNIFCALLYECFVKVVSKSFKYL